jgi:hypothetical protein
MKPLLVVALASALISPATAADRATPDEAKALLQKAAAHYKSVGRAKALADFNAGKAPFKDRDLYVVCLASNSTIAANGQFPKYVGSPVDVLKDSKGKPLGTEILKAGSAKEGGTVSFVMTNPVTGRMEPKVLFAQKFGDDVCGVGAYSAQ